MHFILQIPSWDYTFDISKHMHATFRVQHVESVELKSLRTHMLCKWVCKTSHHYAFWKHLKHHKPPFLNRGLFCFQQLQFSFLWPYWKVSKSHLMPYIKCQKWKYFSRKNEQEWACIFRDCYVIKFSLKPYIHNFLVWCYDKIQFLKFCFHILITNT